eukprot:TRINITY_DN8814_c0_g1_i1.p1 TRINITY_DN8814_c0_g1~~TRINITY_DN8814_c0_g1_i1.p1  ORF type:complete len:213 (+),score=29.65 TRINITY_DN8814_c0_g1_i1:30-641(+)
MIKSRFFHPKIKQDNIITNHVKRFEKKPRGQPLIRQNLIPNINKFKEDFKKTLGVGNFVDVGSSRPPNTSPKIGDLKVQLLYGKNFRATRILNQNTTFKVRPYVIFTIGNNSVTSSHTPIATSNPQWREVLTVPVSAEDKIMEIQVRGFSLTREDYYLGEQKLNFDALKTKPDMIIPAHVYVPIMIKQVGLIELSLVFVPKDY